MSELATCQKEIAKLREELTASQKNVERYRRLRSMGCWLDPNKYAKAGRVLDDAIDAAMKEQQS